ncbi:MAG: DNA mismatch repair protein MutS [Tannerella sp.]|jgi:hypothetical protein|nr:DNA mismatch repair protein MutS [Tannerella sp.]
MEKTVRFYESRAAECTRALDGLNRRIRILGMLRLLVFAGGIAAVWICRDSGWAAWAGIGAVAAAVFAALVVVHSGLFAQRKHVEALLRVNGEELRGLDYDYGAFDGAAEAADGEHDFGVDLDIFGDQSLFRSINRTVTHVGRAMLVDFFKRPPTAKADIVKRQAAVAEMGRAALFRQDFRAAGLSGGGEPDDVVQCRALFAQPLRFVRRSVWRAVVWAIPVLWVAAGVGMVFFGLPSGAAGVAFALSFLVGALPGVRIHRLHKSAEKTEKVLKTYSQLIARIEKASFRCDELREMQRAFVTPSGNASQIIGRLSAIIDALDGRFSLAGLLLQILYLRDVRQAMRLEAWTGAYAGASARWFDALARFDALCSLGGFAFNHPDYVYPEITDGCFRMEGRALGHPLLHRDRCVRNDVSIARSPFFLIVTGANMAGKSTYLRTVGVNFVLACMGLPVCAESLAVTPAHLVTSLRTTDSLAAHESYFFAELKRLKMIIDRLQAGERLFVMLDEALKGTNSHDKQAGSLALMKRLIALGACGVIATHDLLLGTLADEFPDHTRNCCFEADITDDRLTFTYRLRQGIARNMNASFLMKKMGITL